MRVRERISTAFGFTLVLFVASFGLIFRTFYQDTWENLDLPAWSLALSFTLYSVALGFLVASISYKTAPPPRWGNFAAAAAISGTLAVATVLILFGDAPAYDSRADRDDALGIASKNLFAAQSPWGEPTQLSSSHIPTPQLGALLIAAPVALLLGDVKYLALFIIAAVLILLYNKLSAGSMLAFCIVLLGSPITWNELVFQSDVISLALLIVACYLLSLPYMSATKPSLSVGILLTVLVAVAACNRPALSIVFVPLFIAFVRSNLSRTYKVLFSSVFLIIVLALLGVPFTLDPANRRAHGVAVAHAQIDTADTFPFVLGLSFLVFCIGISLPAKSASGITRAAAIVALLVPLAGIITTYRLTGALDFSVYAAVAYNSLFLFLGSLSLLIKNCCSPTMQNPRSLNTI